MRMRGGTIRKYKFYCSRYRGEQRSVITMQLGKLILSYLFLCVACLPSKYSSELEAARYYILTAALGSTNKCRHSPNTDCYHENLLTGWFHDLSSSRVQCFMMNTCSNSSYFSSKEECEQKCALSTCCMVYLYVYR